MEIKSVKRPAGYRSRRFLFREFSSMEMMNSLARDFSWEPLGVRQATPNQSFMAKWQFLPGVEIQYSEEESIESSYVLLSSKLGPNALNSVIAVFDTRPEVVTYSELIADLASATDVEHKGRAVARVGLGAPLAPDENFIRAIEECMLDDDPEVRECAAWAISYTEWSVFRPALMRMAESDSDPFLRKFATATLSAFDKLGLVGP